MRIRIRKRNGRWSVYIVYGAGKANEYEVFYDDRETLIEAHNLAKTYLMVVV